MPRVPSVLRPVALCALFAVAATLVAWALWAAAGPALAALEWHLYDRWIRDGWLAARDARPGDMRLVVVARETAPGDRSELAHVIMTLGQAGAAAIGVDTSVAEASPPARGGAASDALLAQAVAQATVVFPLAVRFSDGAPAARGTPAATVLAPPLPGLVERAGALGHTFAAPEPDGVVRRVPLLVKVGDGTLPAFALALAAAALDAPTENLASASRRAIVLRPRAAERRRLFLPVDGRDRLLVAYDALASPRARRLPFAELAPAIETRDLEALRRHVDGAIVLLLAQPPRGEHRTPAGRSIGDMELQAQLLATIIAGPWLRAPALTWALGAALLLAAAAMAAWAAARWWLALCAAAALACGWIGAAWLAGPAGGLVLPLCLPLGALGLAVVAGAGATFLGSARRAEGLEGEIGTVQRELIAARDAMVRQESAVEALEEDLEAARAAVARSADAEEQLGRASDALRAQLAEASAQEQRTRQRLGELETALSGLRAAELPASAAESGEESRLARECELMGIATRDAKVLALFRDLERAARAAVPILLLGEPGTGKELFARAAHRLSPRAARPFVPVNVAAISGELVESELFGHVRGSFTGSVADRKGYFELADGGTIFLDEIGDLRPEHQSKLLRVLQEQSFYRVGATRPTSVDVRVVAATNRDLERGVAEGWFREDLYFRLKGVVLALPPLRERPGDVALLAARLVAQTAEELGRPGVALSEDALSALRAHGWPGNVRELQHCLRQAVALGEGRLIPRADLRLSAPGARSAPAPRAGAAPAFAPEADPGSDGEVLACLRRHGFDMQATARALGWDRSTVTQRLKGMGFRALVESAGDPAAAARALAGEPVLAGLVETKLREYALHLERTVGEFASAEAALAACRRRFKNLPERHFRSLESLVRQHFERAAR